ncbi:MAG: hypothetical protein WAW80_04370 [Candidatus Saccharimonadales bacterium]
MNDNVEHIHTHKPWYQMRIVLFVSASISVAFFLVVISMTLYASSGAAQLDLSRPGYTAVQSKLDQTESFEDFPVTGSVNTKVVDDFQKLFQQQIKSVNSTDAFSSSALEPQSLGIDAPDTDE